MFCCSEISKVLYMRFLRLNYYLKHVKCIFECARDYIGIRCAVVRKCIKGGSVRLAVTSAYFTGIWYYEHF